MGEEETGLKIRGEFGNESEDKEEDDTKLRIDESIEV
jgi:hypothetical protein